MRYRRARVHGGTYFFTVNLQDRSLDLLVRHVDALRDATRAVQLRHPFEIVAAVVMPEHLHAIWTLPHGDDDFPMRWAQIKGRFSRAIAAGERLSGSRTRQGERGIWQRRYWEHLVRDANDLERHMDYIHYNPVKHGHVSRPIDWPHSSLHRFVRLGMRSQDWGADYSPADAHFGEAY
jgi:putative transposase